ncbi:hypothetical protein BCR41DRAFT_351336 [Lobosporangium transversale]|uniref:Secreted protein n=1 Tax=Lobosporangium transversale TaxID=64571 RepID=A0A1Y2GRL4_9FUNG|nr:hypothetical protein BCR41DRAFT_351336 [Lobosporangium transversale]ORZ20122.1 hypothetical protein BCR41DRAFT_351336 [Lobosporangium transversale]|eukprot:XP_021882662.1 hypothetical protein BCR41DRAFT_351336 [Lobosporangium transversale]
MVALMQGGCRKMLSGLAVFCIWLAGTDSGRVVQFICLVLQTTGCLIDCLCRDYLHALVRNRIEGKQGSRKEGNIR